MKKISILCCFGICLFLLVACGEKKIDAVSQKMINDIDGLGTIELSDEETITKLLNTYSTLTDAQKNQVTNYATLLEAKDTIDELKNQQETAEEAEKEQVLKIQRQYYKDVSSAISSLKSDCKYPTSLVVKNVIIWHTYLAGYENENIYISYSAKNGFGNEIDDSYAYYVDVNFGATDDIDMYSSCYADAIGNSDAYLYKIGDNFYSKTENGTGSQDDWCMLVNLEDYQAQGYVVPMGN